MEYYIKYKPAKFDNLLTQIATKLLKDARREMTCYPKNTEEWGKFEDNAKYALRILKENSVQVIGYYNENYFRVEITEGELIDEVCIVANSDNLSLAAVRRLCLLSVKELSFFNNCGFRIRYQSSI